MIIPRFSHSLSVQCRFEKINVVLVEMAGACYNEKE